MRKVRLLISGYYGFGNLGDELILGSMLKELRGFEVTVLYHQSPVTSHQSPVRMVERSSFFKLIREASRTDLLISGGGGLFQDTTGFFSLLYYLSIIALALILRKPVILYGVGIGPLRRRMSRWLVKRILNRTSGIMVRDRTSLELLKGLRVDKPEIYLTADPVLSLEPPPIKDRDGLRVAFCLREWNGLEEAAIVQAANRLTEKFKAEIVFLPFHPSLDLELCERVRWKIKGAVLIEPSKEKALEIISGFDLLVGMRLHSLILAALARVPMIGLSYDPKVGSFLEEVGQPALRIEDLTSQRLIEKIGEVLQRKALYRQRLKEVMPGLQKRSLQNGKLVRELSETYLAPMTKILTIILFLC
ncbi:polysaccharide pyruvyl transferase CsaB [bacterium]|nr:polysaccharide pyruvyl transferase CsaB [bacterium]